eukprot:scaffold168240_cov35-Attheya_sp.AAC.1
MVSKENHKAVPNERFHRYLDKVEKIHTATCQSFAQWMLGAFFACYAWNSAPVDMTNIVRSFAAKGHEFPLPIDHIGESAHERNISQELHNIDPYPGNYSCIFR